MPSHVPLSLEPFTPGRGAAGITKGGKLLEGVTLKIATNLDNAKVTIAGAPHCKDLPVPGECLVSAGTYKIDYSGPQGAKATHTVTVAAKPVTSKFEFGFVEAGAGKKLAVNPPGGKLALEVGTRTVTVSDENGTHQATVKVKPGATAVAN
jgi:hypothetical protein